LSEAGNAREGFLGEKELAAVIEQLPADLQDFVRSAAATGIRKSEAAGLTWKMVQGTELRIPGNICKNRKSRVLPLAGELAEILERRKSARRIEENGTVRMGEFIFHRDGEPIREFRKSWKSPTKKANLPGILFHDLRRSAVRNMVKAGVSPQIAKKWSGHISDSMFARYSILTTDDLREAFETTQKFREAEKAKVVAMR
jgi:integrase